MRKLLMDKETMLTKIPFHLVDYVRRMFEKCEQNSKEIIDRYEVYETERAVTIKGYTPKGKTYALSEPLQKIYRSDIDPHG